MIPALEKRITERWPDMAGRTELHYALLSDMCHPSVGRQLLVVEDMRQVPGPSGLLPILQFHTGHSDQKVRWFLLNTSVPMVSQLGIVAKDTLMNVHHALRRLEAARERRNPRD